MSALAQLRDVVVVHRTAEGSGTALQGLTLDVEPGEVLAVLGPSGAGKSTLLRVLAALQRPSAGTVQVGGVDLARLSPRAAAAWRARGVGIVDQHYAVALPPDLPVGAIVAQGLALAGSGRGVRGAAAASLLDRVGLGDRAQACPHELSGGEQQRVAVCAAVAHRPSLVLADEPGGELDATNAAAVYALLRDVARDEGATVVLVTHDEAALAIADRVVRVRDGRVCEESRPGEPGRLVVGHGGWIWLPERLRRDAGIGGHASPETGAGGLVLRGDGGEAEALEAAEALPAPGPGEVVATLRGVTLRRGPRVVLDGFDLQLRRGLLTCVTGRSGSGKSSLLDLLAGLIRADAGEVVVAGSELGALDAEALADLRRRHVSVCGQAPALLGALSAAENVALACEARGVPRAEALEAASPALGAVGLAPLAAHRVERLSAGERQRVAVARALAPGADLVLVDEPTSRLDEDSAHRVSLLLARAARAGAAVVCATHDPAVIAHADEVVPLDASPAAAVARLGAPAAVLDG